MYWTPWDTVLATMPFTAGAIVWDIVDNRLGGVLNLFGHLIGGFIGARRAHRWHTYEISTVRRGRGIRHRAP